MEQHPIPQHISSYQFRLVGDMTLKQFFQLAGCALISLVIYASPLHPLIKWPMVLFFALLGVALAFLPFEERPLEVWIVSFFKSIYSPTQYSWKKEPKKFFQDEGAPTPSEKIIAPGGEGALKEYLSQPTQKTGFITNLEESEKSFLSKLGQMFNILPQTQPVAASAPTPVPPMPQLAYTPIPAPLAPQLPVEQKPVPEVLKEEVQLSRVAQTLPGQEVSFGKEAQFSLGAAPPNPSTQPNIVVGQVLDSQGKIIDAGILEIRDAAGRPVRALRSNKLGHFTIATPLLNGRYQIITEKEGYGFEPITFDAVGEIIPPIEIKAKPSQGMMQQTASPQVQPTIQ